MNDADLKEALHIPQSAGWKECNMIKYHRGEEASQWIYPSLKGNMRILHFGGDTDGVVPVIGTQAWMEDLGWPITKPYHQWTLGKYDLGGWF
jgi:serine carboxypeptidase-like clade 2